ncbi:uncharacterized protein LOC115083775 [Rhinatrema bivittatum]|uniref:uncharacterized protein LOC115083775 n=1 Tax=Rhinatrema bivittatum TaxID=194408 RepID=UPI00112BF261|nr:uncharacterized protein LOC115083775 [Rhinatrema bivittatum]
MAAEAGNSVAVCKAVSSASKAEDVRKDMEMTMKPYPNWEAFLMSAPLSIAILGELVFISGGQGDFTINKNPPEKGFQYIRYPESFRSCLMQVCNQGCSAFNVANKNMDQIRLLSMSVPGTMETIVQTLSQDIQVVNALLPTQLGSIKSVSDQCKQLAVSVEKKFDGVISLIHELLEACTNAKQGYEEENKEIKIALEQAQIKEESAMKCKEIADKHLKMTEEQLDDARSQYKKAMDSLSIGWSAVGVGFVRRIITAPTKFISGIHKWISKKSSGTTKETNDGLATNNVYLKSEVLLRYVTALGKFIDTKNSKIIQEIYDPQTETCDTELLKTDFKKLKVNIEKENECTPKNTVIQLCEAGIKICDDLKNIAKSGKKDTEEIERLAKSMADLQSNTHEFVSSSKVAMNQLAVPEAAKSDCLSTVTENAHFKIEKSKQDLQLAWEVYQQSFKNLEKQDKELTEILCTMRKCEIREIDFEKAKEMLNKGLDALGRVKEQWEQMVRFFQMMSNLTETCLSRSIMDMVSSAESVPHIPNYTSDAFVKDQIYNKAFNASNIAHLVHMISETYTEVSNNYLMKQVSRLGRLMAMDSNGKGFQDERKDFEHGCDEARVAIRKKATEKKQELEANMEPRMRKFSSALNAILSPASEEELKEIKDTEQKDM